MDNNTSIQVDRALKVNLTPELLALQIKRKTVDDDPAGGGSAWDSRHVGATPPRVP